MFDRSQSGKSVTDAYGTVRRCDFSEEALEIRLFMDESSVEIFVNDGLEALQRVFIRKQTIITYNFLQTDRRL